VIFDIDRVPEFCADHMISAAISLAERPVQRARPSKNTLEMAF